MENTCDYSKNISGLVDDAIKAADKGGKVYLGKFHDFNLFVRDRCLWLTSGSIDMWDLHAYLTKYQWCVGGIPEPAGLEGNGNLSLALDINRITIRKEKLCREMSELSELLKVYRMLTAPDTTIYEFYDKFTQQP